MSAHAQSQAHTLLKTKTNNWIVNVNGNNRRNACANSCESIKNDYPIKYLFGAIDRYLCFCALFVEARTFPRKCLFRQHCKCECWMCVCGCAKRNKSTTHKRDTRNPETNAGGKSSFVFPFSVCLCREHSAERLKATKQTSNDSTNRSLKTTKNKRPHYFPVIEVHEDSSAIHTNLQHIHSVIATQHHRGDAPRFWIYVQSEVKIGENQREIAFWRGHFPRFFCATIPRPSETETENVRILIEWSRKKCIEKRSVKNDWKVLTPGQNHTNKHEKSEKRVLINDTQTHIFCLFANFANEAREKNVKNLQIFNIVIVLIYERQNKERKNIKNQNWFVVVLFSPRRCLIKSFLRWKIASHRSCKEDKIAKYTRAKTTTAVSERACRYLSEWCRLHRCSWLALK